jgi:hypothetical protein
MKKAVVFLVLMVLATVALCFSPLVEVLTAPLPRHHAYEKHFVPLFPDGEKLDSIMEYRYNNGELNRDAYSDE